MKSSILFVFLFAISSVFGQTISDSSENHFGVAINSSALFGLSSVSFAPTGFYYKNKHQFELGLGIHPLDDSFERKLGVEFNYKYFVNGIENRFNFYFIGRAGVVNSLRTSTVVYPLVSGDYIRKENHLSATVGYGFQLKLFKGAYLGTDINIGGATRNVDSKNTATGSNYFSPMFKSFYLERVIQLSIGYRF